MRKLIVLLIMVSVGGCTWQRIPDAPSYNCSRQIPIKLGVILGNTQPSQVYGPQVVSNLKEMIIFESIIYPYRDGDPVDGILNMTITGEWKGSGAGAGFLIGLSLFTLSPVLGPSMTGTHDLNVVLSKGGTGAAEVSRYSANIKTSVSWGLLGDTNEVASKADKLLQQKITAEIAQRICEDQARILKALGK